MQQASVVTSCLVLASFLPGCKARDIVRPITGVPETLSVLVGQGVSGAPQSGTMVHFGDSILSYSFQLDSGYRNLAVSLGQQSLPPTGTIWLDGNQLLMASADRSIALPVPADPTVSMLSALLTQVNPVMYYSTLLEQMEPAFRTAGQEEASEGIELAAAVAFDFVRDSAAFSILYQALADQTFGDDNLFAMTDRGLGRPLSPSRSTTILYVNGILNTPLQAGTDFLYLRSVLQSSGFATGLTAPFHVHFFFNAAWRNNPGAQLVECLNRLSTTPLGIQSHGFASWTAIIANCAINPVNGVTTVIRQQIGAALQTHTPGLTDLALAEFLRSEIARNRRVVVVPHSHGNLLSIQALKNLIASLPIGARPLDCIGITSVASPISGGWPTTNVKRIIVRDQTVADIIWFLSLQFGGPSPSFAATDTSSAYERQLQAIPTGNGALAVLAAWALLTSDFYLHSFRASYMAGDSSRSLILASLRTQDSVLSTSCHDDVSVSPTTISVAIGATDSVTAEITTPLLNKRADMVPSWRSDDTAIASVDGLGVVVGKRLGTTRVWAVVPGDSAASQVTVTADTSVYTILALHPLPGDSGSAAFEVNNAGQVLGFSFVDNTVCYPLASCRWRSVLWDGASTYALPIGFQGYGLTENGVVFGFVGDSLGYHGATWTVAEGLRYVDPWREVTYLYAMNDNRVGYGTYTDSAGLTHHGFWSNGAWQRLPHQVFKVIDMNNARQLVGYEFSSGVRHPFVWHPGDSAYVVLPSVGPGDGIATDINEVGEVVGGDQEGAVLWRNGARISLGVQQSALAHACAINNASIVVGLDQDRNPFVWHGGLSRQLRTMIASSAWSLVSPPPAWSRQSRELDINDAGQIAGTGVLHVPNGGFRGYLLSPKLAQSTSR